MSNEFSQALREWQNFYFMIGSASATLVGLIFVALSLGGSVLSSYRPVEVQIYVTPTVVHFAMVLVSAALMLIPALGPGILGSGLLVLGIVGVAISIRTARWMWQQGVPMNSLHWLSHALMPFLSYVLVIATGMGLVSGVSEAMIGLAFGTIILVIAGLRNSWELTLWILKNRHTPGSEG